MGACYNGKPAERATLDWFSTVNPNKRRTILPSIPLISREAAKAAGLKRFFTGTPCFRGHITERKVCDGGCFSCLAITRRLWREQNIQKERERQNRDYWKDPERHRATARRFAANHADALREKRSQWRKDNPEAARLLDKRSYEKYRKKYSDYFKSDRGKAVRNKSKRKNKDKLRIHAHNRIARKKKAEGRHTLADIQDLYRLQRGRCALCHKPLRKKFHVDHNIPLCRGGSNWKHNLQLTCSSCNLNKGSKDPIEFAQQNGRLL